MRTSTNIYNGMAGMTGGHSADTTLYPTDDGTVVALVEDDSVSVAYSVERHGVRAWCFRRFALDDQDTVLGAVKVHKYNPLSFFEGLARVGVVPLSPRQRRPA